MNNLTTQQIFWDLINFSTEEQSAGVGSTEKPGVGSWRAREIKFSFVDHTSVLPSNGKRELVDMYLFVSTTILEFMVFLFLLKIGLS